MTGWFARRRRAARVSAMRDPAPGRLEITWASLPPTDMNATFSNYHLTGIVHVDGLAPVPVEQRGIARVASWPAAGRQLPVTVDRAAPTTFVIDWAQVVPVAQQAVLDTENLAVHELSNLDPDVLDQARQEQSGAPAAAPPAGPVDGTVVAVTKVPAPVAPPGGSWDLTVHVGERYVLVRADCATDADAHRVAVVNAPVTVTIDPANPDVGRLSG